MNARILLLALFVTVSLQAAEPTIGWHTVTAGETLEGITARYLGSSRGWQENWKLNPSLKDPHKLTPGMRIRVIVARAVAARNAEVWSVAKQVERQPTPEPWTRAAVGDRLREKHGLRTHESSSAGLRFDDGASLVLTENSLVFLRETAPAQNAIARDSIEIVEGQADVETRKPAKSRKSAEIEVLVAGATVRPNEAKSQTRARAASKSAQFMVYDGQAAVEAAGATLVVPTGMGTRVPEGSAPGPLEKLLPAPNALAPLANASRVGPAAFRWSAVAGAETYSIEVCRDAACASLVGRASVPTTAWTPRGLPPGELFWRVRGVAASGLDGFATAPVKFANAIAASGSVVDEATGAPFGGARVVAYRDGGAVEAEGVTDDLGRFALPLRETGAYWIAVDSKTLRAGAWPEQTAAPAGGVCDGIERRDAGPCFGGRRADVSDDARSLETSEHVARVTLDESRAESGAERLDFRFRFDTVTTTRDDGQGSLRQFLVNANAIPGPAAMRFTPAQRAQRAFWTITLATPLPDVLDDTVIDGAAYGAAGDHLATNRGTVSETVSVGEAGTMLLTAEQAELEIVAAGLPYALRSRRALTVKNVALSGAETSIDAHGTLTVQNAIIGARADGSRSDAPGGTGVALNGGANATMHRVHVAGQAAHGVRVDAARLSADHLEITRCRTGVALHASIADIRYSLVSDVDIRPGQNGPWGNVVEQCTLAVSLAPSPGNRVAGNVVRAAD